MELTELLEINLTELLDADLTAHQEAVQEAFDELIADETPDRAKVDQAKALKARLDEIAAEDARRTEEAQALADELAELRDYKKAQAEAEKEPEVVEDPEAEVVVEVEPEAPVVSDAPAQESIAARASTVALIASKSERPAPPAASRQQNGPVKIVAAANTEFSTGTDLGSDLEMVGKSVIEKVKAYNAPTGDGSREDLSYAPIAKFKLDYEDDLRQTQTTNDYAQLLLAKDESRLPGDSLVAASGWCAPSETLYDLCTTESTDGIGSVPEMAITRGGIKYTSGPDWSAIYGASGYFDFTEAQSIAGTGQSVSKPCMTVPCPSFTDVRLDSVGLCVKVEFLQNAGYPEVTQRFIAGALVAHQHKVWLKVLNKMLGLATAKTWLAGAGSPDGSVSADTLDGLSLYATQLRQKYRLPLNTSLEVLLPIFVKEVIKSDISRRTGQPFQVVTDGEINAWFSARQMNPQFVYGLPAGTATGGVDLALADVTGPPADSDTWPTVFTALMYPAGTFVKGNADVVNLSTVYDAASLANNVYTGLFVEQGVLVAQMCPEAFKVTLPVCAAGRTGLADLSCA